MPLVSKTFNQLLDFTRTSAATVVGSDGLIRTTAASRNLLLWTQAIGGSSWLQNSTTPTLNNATAPDGTNTASLITLTSASNFQTYQNTSVLTGAITMSCYIKTGSITWIQFFYGGSNSSYANFNVSSGTLGDFTGTATITAVGDGWYRCTHTFTPATNASSVVINTVDSGTAGRAAITASSSGTWYLWGAQLEAAATASTYTRNNGGVFPPRFDFDPVTLAPKGLLIEEQRTNLFTYSEQIDNAAWAKVAGVVVTANQLVSPDGTMDADLATTSANFSYFRQSITATASAPYTVTMFVKPVSGGTVVRLTLGNNASTEFAGSRFDLTGDGSLGLTDVVGTAVIGSRSITKLSNGWYRCSLTATMNSTTLFGGLDNHATTVMSYGVWGAQLEAGAFATSYIPTVASQVTRTADQCSIVAPNFAPWYNQSEGTFVAEWLNANTSAAGRYIVRAVSPTVSQGISIWINSNGIDTRAWVGATVITAGNASLSVKNKAAFGYKAADNAASVNGASAVTSNATGPTDAISFELGGTTSGFLNGHIRSIRYYPTRLSNAQLQALSA
jgi:hypothetical protein